MMEGWKDVKRVDPLRVESALEQAGHPTSLEAILALARSLGAGRVIWGEVNPIGDSIRVRGAVFDSRRRDADPLREAGFSLAGTLAGSPALSARELGIGFAKLTRELIVPGAGNAGEVGVGLGTSYSLALEAKLRGDSAFSQWNLPLARQAYLHALTVDPVFPQANLSLAQLEQWDGSPRDKWRPYVVTAMVAPARLSAAQQEQARALMAMADEEYPGACDRYRGMIARDSSNFVAWYGLGECQAEDHYLVADARSPAGWRFRSSYHSAIGAYSKALKLVPLTSSAFGGAALSRLVNRFYADPGTLRLGHPGGDRSRVLMAFPGFETDTLVFWPDDPEEVLSGEIPYPTQDRAVQAAREALLSVTTAWVTALPNSVPTLQAQATALEMTRGVGGAIGDSALRLLGRARQRAVPASHFGLGFQSVGVLLKQRKYEAAASLADTLLSPGRFDDADLEQAAILSALRGRVERTAALMAEDAVRDTLYTPEGEAVEVPLPVREMAQRLLAYAAFGLPADSVRALRNRIMAATATMADTVMRGKVRDAALQRPILLAFPMLGVPMDLGHVWTIEGAIARGDTAGAKAGLTKLAGLRQGLSDLLPADATLLEARLRLMVGDSTGAKAQLSAFQERMDVAGMNVMPRMEHAASLGGILVLDGKLGGTGGEESAHNAKVLWARSESVGEN
jgi:tetratricopeptide (TPR) repeat protein